ncbi:acyl-CoA synthetase [Deferrisoma camini]|uniref:acyl-CoA synthetase n=1 Tax=Deferrisoma camini TaxID=1035120 RepID=UPI00046CFFB4|nr:acyl-CoA synthetase [Deferrisoma camini]
MLAPGRTYDEVVSRFRWKIPDRYNIAVDVCDRQDPEAVALIYVDEAGAETRYTFGTLAELSNRLANALAHRGVGRGDRVGILLGQCPETALTHLAVYKLGAVAVPLFSLFGPDALEYRLSHSGARAVVTDGPGLAKVLEIRDRLPELELVLTTGSDAPGRVLPFWDELRAGAPDRQPADTGADDPALIIYTSGTTGPPKGALHAHRTLLGHLPGVEFPHEFFPQPGDRFWTPADWAWIGGLIDVLLPSWHHGVPVLAYRARKFDPEEAFFRMGRHAVRNAFLPPTALRMMRQVGDPGRFGARLRTVGSGGESLGEDTLAWGREALGVTINEFYGQTEVNLVVSNCAGVMEVRPGSMGRPVPGHTVAVIDDAGNPLPPGEMGEVAVRRPDPVMFLGYWRNPEATRRKFAGEWCRTGDLARADEDGYLWFQGRADDLILSAGYRIGPTEIEDSLMQHPAVARAAVIGSPDPVRGEVVKAYLVLAPGWEATAELERQIQEHVRSRLAAHEYPRRISFVEELPLTATGKIKRDVLRRWDREGR